MASEKAEKTQRRRLNPNPITEPSKVSKLAETSGTSTPETATDDEKIIFNLSATGHPAELPPVTMMNWLIVLEERHNDFN